MEVAALSVGKSVLMGALGYGKSKAGEEVALQLDVEDDGAFIAHELEMMQSFLMTADEEHGQNKVLITWVKHVRDLAYTAENSLMDFSLLSEKKSWWQRPQTMVDRRRIAMEMKKLRARVEDVSNRILRYRHINDSSGSKPIAGAEDASMAMAMFGGNEARFAGFTAHEKSSKVNLQHLITCNTVDLRVVAVWGSSSDPWMTSAIQEVYDDPEVLKMFGFRAWVRLMHPFNPQEFLRSLVRQFYENSHDEVGKAEQGTSVGANVLAKMQNMDQSDLVRVFNAQLCSNSYLVVINELCTIEEWHCVKKYFPDNKKQSRIIVSAQQVEIASLCTEKPYQVSKLEQLSCDQTIYLFHTKNPVSEVWSGAMDKDQLNEDQELLIKLVCQPDNNQVCKVISVWGKGGVGKTTLVRSIYRCQQLGSWKRAWTTVLHPFNPEVLLRNLALQLQMSDQEDHAGATGTGGENRSIPEMNLQELKQELARVLKMERCLVVLDGISSTYEWYLLKSCLGNAERIIVTTREKYIAKCCSREDKKNMYRFKGLKDDAALDLFIKKVSRYNIGKIGFAPVMMEQARLILKKCHGIPLVISTIGGLLASKPKTATEWWKINTELEKNPGDEGDTVMAILKMSYDGLPNHLKSALLYMSIFPRHQNIKWGRLARRWIAEGYSEDMLGITGAELSRRYFEELMDRSMILPGEGIYQCSQKIDICQLPDMIREICISKARAENLVFTLEEGCWLRNTQGVIQHLVIGSNWKRNKDVLEKIPDLSRIRSLTVFGEWRSFFISNDMRFLRVLDLEDTLGLRDHHLDQIGQLHHLIYLSLRGCSSILYLPNSLQNLRHLQTLDVRGTSVFELPTTITNLWKLQYLYADGYWNRGRNVKGECGIVDKYSGYIDRVSTRKKCSVLLSRCHLFFRPQVLDAGLNRHDIFNLYRFSKVHVGGVVLPRGIGKLKALHTLGIVDVSGSNGKATIKELRDLIQLRKLRVFGISYKNSNEFWSAIVHHNDLQSLAVHEKGLDSEDSPLDVCLGEGLLPPSSLESLTLCGKLVNATEWFHQIQNLSKLVLEQSRLNQDDAIQVLGCLPNLAVLRMGLDSFTGEQLHFQSYFFPTLMVLELVGLNNLQSVLFEEDTMPKLELLRVNLVAKLNHISGLAALTSLQEIWLGSECLVLRQAAEYMKHVSVRFI